MKIAFVTLASVITASFVIAFHSEREYQLPEKLFDSKEEHCWYGEYILVDENLKIIFLNFFDISIRWWALILGESNFDLSFVEIIICSVHAFQVRNTLVSNTFAQRCKLGARGMVMGDVELRRLSSSRIGWKAVAS